MAMRSPMSPIVRVVSSYLYPAIIVYGIYLVVHGHLTPGGGFQGGAVAASAIALMIVAYGSHYYKKGRFSAIESLGLLFFIGLALMGTTVVFFQNFLVNTGGLFGDPTPLGPNPGFLNTGGIIPLMNIAVGLEVVGAVGLALIILARGPEDKRIHQPVDKCICEDEHPDPLEVGT